jgi:hypothetical protein
MLVKREAFVLDGSEYVYNTEGVLDVLTAPLAA